MKKTSLVLGAFTALALTPLVWLNFGCGKKQTGGETPPAASTPKIVSAEKTSFNEVTSQLDPGGNFYLYLGTAQWLEHLSSKVEAWRTGFTSMPDMTPAAATNIDKAFDVITSVIKESGVEDITGVGMSSVEMEKGMFHNKILLHHYAGKGTGFLWKLCGKEPHALNGLDLLPTNTALAGFSDADLPLLWNVIQDEVGKSGIPQAKEFLDKLPAQFEQNVQMKWEDFLKSLGDEIGFVLTLDESRLIPVPLPGAALQVPEPGVMLVLKVNDDAIFNRIDEELKKNPQVISMDQTGLKMRTLPVPMPFLGVLRPTTASAGGYLFIASSDDLVNEALAVKSGKSPGLKSTEEFKRLARDLPDQGNQFTFMSERFGRVLFDIQRQAISTQTARAGQSAQAKWIQSLFQSKPAFAFSVEVNTPEGCLTVGNGNQSFANVALVPLVAVPAMMSAIAIPNFVKARATAQQNTCINNLRQLDAAKQQWALENGKTTTDTPTKDDLLPYLKQWPTCPAGGTYTIGSVGENPTCSIPKHRLPE